jgi:hypothetical protein
MNITDTIPTNIVYINTAFAFPVAGVSISGSALTVNFNPTVTAGAIGSFTIRAKFAPGVTPTALTANNTATINATGVPSVTSNVAPITSAAIDKLTIVKTVVANGALDNYSQYKIKVCANNTNNLDEIGYLMPTAVTVTDTLPAGAVFVSSTPAASVAGQVLTWTPTILVDGVTTGCAANDILVTVSYPSSDPANTVGAVKNNTTDITYTPTGGTQTTKTSSASHTLPATLVGYSHTKYHDYGNTIAVGATVNFNIDVTNTGTTTNDITITDPIPPECNVTRFYAYNPISIDYQKNGINAWISGVTLPVFVLDVNSGTFPGFTTGDYVSNIRVTYDNVMA